MSKNVMSSIGTALGAAGAALCVLSGGVRLGGVYALAGFELRTLFLVGTSVMVMGCLAKLHALVELQSQSR
ncbi:MAG: hypothetical protein PVF91_00325 [Chromatiales bacterium]|jgi:hypothetical protein